MVIGRGERDLLFGDIAAVALDHILGKLHIFKGIGALVFLHDLLGRDPLTEQIARHRLAFGNDLVASLTARGHKHRVLAGLFRLFPFKADRAVYPAPEQRHERSVAVDTAAENDDVVAVTGGKIFRR